MLLSPPPLHHRDGIRSGAAAPGTPSGRTPSPSASTAPKRCPHPPTPGHKGWRPEKSRRRLCMFTPKKPPNDFVGSHHKVPDMLSGCCWLPPSRSEDALPLPILPPASRPPPFISRMRCGGSPSARRSPRSSTPRPSTPARNRRAATFWQRGVGRVEVIP